MTASTKERYEDLAAQLADGIDALVDSDAWQAHLAHQARFRRYSFRNTMLIVMQCPQATQVAGKTKWAEMGRTVIDGATPILIWGPTTRKATTTNEDGEEETVTFGSFRLCPVYDVSQTEGDEMPPSPCHLLDGEDEHGMFDRLVTVAGGIGFKVWQTPEIDGYPGANGLCEHGARKITVASDRSPLQQVKTLIHELAHAILHEHVDYVATRGDCELEAESVAYIVASTLGLDTSAYSFGYVANWQGGSAKRARKQIKASLGNIQKAAAQITGGLEKQEVAVAAAA